MADFNQAVNAVIHNGGLPDIEPNAGPGRPAATVDQARATWEAFHFDQIPDQAVANKVFDLAVCIGPVMAIRILQLALFKFSPTPLVADGKIGPATVAAVAGADVAGLLLELRARFAKYHAELCIENPQRKVLLLAWLRRDVT